jgi:Fic family protein
MYKKNKLMNKMEKLERYANKYWLALQEQPDLQKSRYYTFTHHSTAIAGSSLTEYQVFRLLERDIPAKTTPFSEQQMVVDHQKALAFTMDEAKAHTPLTETLIRKIGSLMVKSTGGIQSTTLGTFDSTSGDYRLQDVSIGTRHFPDSADVPALIHALVNEINDKIGKAQTFFQKCELAFDLHFRLASIHPFADGNGRTGRLLMNYLLTVLELPAFYIFKVNKVSYFRALEKARTTGMVPFFYAFMYDQYKKFIWKELKRVEK